MNTYMKSLFASLLLITATATANAAEESLLVVAPVEQSTGYFSLGVGPLPVPLPTFTVGYRKQVNHHGFDASLQAATIVEYTQLKLNTIYQHYFKPNLASQFYVGAGLGTSYAFGTHHHNHKHTLAFSPEVVLGKQYQNEANDTRFIQAQISFPTVALNHAFDQSKHIRGDMIYMPLVVLSYGFGF